MRKKNFTPRQQIFGELTKMLERVRKLEDMTSADFDDLDTVLLLARKTGDAIGRGYKLNRTLLLSIYAFLVGDTIDLTRLDVNWDGLGQLPTIEFNKLLAVIAEAVAKAVPSDESPIDCPFEGERTTCASLRGTFLERVTERGVTEAVQAFA